MAVGSDVFSMLTSLDDIFFSSSNLFSSDRDQLIIMLQCLVITTFGSRGCCCCSGKFPQSRFKYSLSFFKKINSRYHVQKYIVEVFFSNWKLYVLSVCICVCVWVAMFFSQFKIELLLPANIKNHCLSCTMHLYLCDFWYHLYPASTSILYNGE